MKAALKLGAIGVGLLCVICAMVPWKVVEARRFAEMADHLGKATGLTIRVGGQITLKLLPRPRIRMTDVSIRDANGSFSADAPALYGDLELAALLKDGWRLVSATLSEPTITLDVDRAPVSTLLWGQIAQPSSLPLKVSLRSGVVRIRSRQPGADTLITDVNATAQQGSKLDDRLALSGSALWHAAVGQFTARVAHPRAILDGGSSAAFLQLTSGIESLSAAGDLSGGTQPQFSGKLALSSNTLPRLFAALSLPAPWLSVQRASLTGDAVVRAGDFSLSGSTLRLDDTMLEGTLGLHGDAGRILVEGTLATDYLDMSGLAARGLNPHRAGFLYRRDINSDLLQTNVDLRLSASVAHWGTVDVQDAAFSALSHDGRFEITLDEASAFNGTVKARAVASAGSAGIEAHGEASASNIDLGPLSAALFGQEKATGALTGRIEIEGKGHSLSDIVHASAGEGQVSVQSGNFVGLSVTQALKRFTRKLPWGDAQTAQITAFDTASTAIRVTRGVVDFVDGRVIGPGIQLSFGGQSDLPQGKIDILALAAQTDAAGSLVAGGARLPLEMRGTWGEPLSVVEHARGLAFPALPMIGPAQVSP